MAVLTYQLIPDTHPGSSTAQCLPSNPLLRLLHRSGTFHSQLNTWSKETTTTTKTNKNLGNFEKQNSPPDEISNSTRKIDWFSQHSQCNWNWSQPYEAQQFIPLLILGCWHGMSGAVNNATFTSWVCSHIEWACSRPVTLMVSTVAIQFYKELSTRSCHQVCQISFNPLPPCSNPKTINNQIYFEEGEAFGYLSKGIIKSPNRQLEGFLI